MDRVVMVLLVSKVSVSVSGLLLSKVPSELTVLTILKLLLLLSLKAGTMALMMLAALFKLLLLLLVVVLVLKKQAMSRVLALWLGTLLLFLLSRVSVRSLVMVSEPRSGSTPDAEGLEHAALCWQI